MQSIGEPASTQSASLCSGPRFQAGVPPSPVVGEARLLGGDRREVDSLVLSPGRKVDLGGTQASREAELGLDAVDTVAGVDVLHQHNLEAGSRALARGDGRVSEEVLPDLDR